MGYLLLARLKSGTPRGMRMSRHGSAGCPYRECQGLMPCRQFGNLPSGTARVSCRQAESPPSLRSTRSGCRCRCLTRRDSLSPPLPIIRRRLASPRARQTVRSVPSAAVPGAVAISRSVSRVKRGVSPARARTGTPPRPAHAHFARLVAHEFWKYRSSPLVLFSKCSAVWSFRGRSAGEASARDFTRCSPPMRLGRYHNWAHSRPLKPVYPVYEVY